MPLGWPRTLLSIVLVTALTLCRPVQCSCLCDTTSNWDVLMALYNDLGGANWTSSAKWDVSSESRSACRLYGITCDNTTGGITSVVFPSPIDMSNPWDCASLGLRGTLPALLSQWNATLISLRFCNQQGIAGTVPSSFAALSNLEYYALVTLPLVSLTALDTIINSGFTKLRHLCFGSVGVGGTIPTWSVCPANLTRLQVEATQLTGAIPQWVANCSQLQYLWITRSSIGGPVPSPLPPTLVELGLWRLLIDGVSITGAFSKSTLPQLLTLRLTDNPLRSTIPQDICRFTSLEVLWLYSSSLVSDLPSCIGSNLVNLVDLQLDSNSLAGEFPMSWSSLTAMRTFIASSNALNGTLPEFIGDSWRSLRALYLFSNSISGTIPHSWGNLTALSQLFLTNNIITGTIPSSFAALTLLSIFNVGNNKISDTLPAFIGTWRSLQQLVLYLNSFSGTIPESWGNLTQLMTMYFYRNFIGGTLPSFVGTSMLSLQYLNFNTNHFTGTIPESWGSLGRLRSLAVRNNKLTGTIPRSLDALTSLLLFRVSDNMMNGTLPTFIGTFWLSLQELYLNGNSFSGAIPESWGNLTQLTTLVLNSNLITGALPVFAGNWSGLVVVDMRNNTLSGTIPSSWGLLTKITALLLSSNQLNGTLPSFVGTSMMPLSSIYLDGNSFTGPLPPSWGLLRSLATLQLQGNSLSGSLPSYWGAGLPALGSFSVNGGATRFCGGVPATWDNSSVLVAAVAGIVSPQCGHNDTPPHYSFVAQANASLASCEMLCSVQLPRGFVATPTSAAENALLAAVLPSGDGRYLLGGSRGGTPDYRWVSGPLGREDDGAGALLFVGGAAPNGTAVMFSAFAPLQPSAGGPQLFVSGGGTVGHLDAARGQWFNGDDAGDGCVCQATWRSISPSRSPSSRATWSVSRSGSVSATASCSVSPSSLLSLSASCSLLTSMSMSASFLVSRSAVPSLSRSAVLGSTTATGGSLGMTQSPLLVTATHTLSGTSSASTVPALLMLDTRAPAPAIFATMAASGAAAATAVLSSTIRASSVVALAQLGLATLRLSHRCDAPLDADGAVGAAPLDNPLHLSLPSLPPSLQFAGGAVVGNTLLLCLLGVLGCVLELRSEALRCGCDLRRLAFLVRSGVTQRLPGLLMSPLNVVLQPTLAAAVSLLASADRTAGTVALGCLGVAVHGGLALWMCVRVHGGLHCLTSVAIDSPTGALLAGGGVQSWLSSVELRLGEALRSHWRWTRAGDGAAAAEVFERYAPCFEEYRRGMPVYFAFELCTSAAAAVATGLGMTLSGAGSSVCDATAAANWALLALAVLQLGVISYLRPMGVPLSNYLMVLLSACNVVATVLSIAVDSVTSSWFAFAMLVLLCAVNTVRVGLAVWGAVQGVLSDVMVADARGMKSLSLAAVMEGSPSGKTEPLDGAASLRCRDVSSRLAEIIATICDGTTEGTTTFKLSVPVL